MKSPRCYLGDSQASIPRSNRVAPTCFWYATAPSQEVVSSVPQLRCHRCRSTRLLPPADRSHLCQLARPRDTPIVPQGRGAVGRFRADLPGSSCPAAPPSSTPCRGSLTLLQGFLAGGWWVVARGRCLSPRSRISLGVLSENGPKLPSCYSGQESILTADVKRGSQVIDWKLDDKGGK